MVHATRENEIYRRDAKLNHGLLSPAEREKLIQVCSRLDRKIEFANKLTTAVPTNAAIKVARPTAERNSTTSVKSKISIKIWRATLLEEPASCSPIRYNT